MIFSGVLHGVSPGISPVSVMVSQSGTLVLDRENWVTEAGLTLELPQAPEGRRLKVVNSTTSDLPIFSDGGMLISGISGGFRYSGLRRAVVAAGATAVFLSSGGEWIVSGAVLTPPDLFAANLELALPLSVATGLVDQSPSIRTANGATAGTAKTVTGFGSAAISTTQSKYYGSSLSLNGTGQYLTASGHTVPGTGDFCYEGWFNQSSLKDSACLLDTGGGGVGLDSLLIYFSISSLVCYHNGVARININSVVGVWNHFALWRSSGVWRMALNGVVSGTTYSSSANLSSTGFFIGNYVSPSATYAFNGSLQDIRYYQGVAKYGTANFTTPGAIV